MQNDKRFAIERHAIQIKKNSYLEIITKTIENENTEIQFSNKWQTNGPLFDGVKLKFCDVLELINLQKIAI